MDKGWKPTLVIVTVVVIGVVSVGVLGRLGRQPIENCCGEVRSLLDEVKRLAEQIEQRVPEDGPGPGPGPIAIVRPKDVGGTLTTEWTMGSTVMHPDDNPPTFGASGELHADLLEADIDAFTIKVGQTAVINLKWVQIELKDNHFILITKNTQTNTLDWTYDGNELTPCSPGENPCENLGIPEDFHGEIIDINTDPPAIGENPLSLIEAITMDLDN